MSCTAIEDFLGRTLINETVTAKLNAAIKSDSSAQMTDALMTAADYISLDECCQLLNNALDIVVRSGSVRLTQCLIDEGAEVSSLSMFAIKSQPSIPLFEALLAAGYDFTKAGPKNCGMIKGRNMLHMVIQEGHMVEWLLDHGTPVDLGEPIYAPRARPPPLLEYCACLGSVDTFKLLKTRGAKLTRRCLHVAVGEAASAGIDPSRTIQQQPEGVEVKRDGSQRSYLNDRAEMLRYFVDELHLDVNDLDSDNSQFEFWGTPLNYATRHGDSAVAVVKWLLAKGVDPTIPSVTGKRARDFTDEFHGSKILEVLENHRQDGIEL